jgi:oligoribonuclease NrnB/cAMP/cGMP phosphodiesterase (DHH superfamily)|tara:strand:+ start:339 stop:602 length:264 start_codon:yes stop_codon:yes gene_type:complete
MKPVYGNDNLDADVFNDTAEKDLKLLSGDYKQTFTSKEGERVLQDLMEAYYKRISFSRDPYATAYNEGQRAVVVRILNLLKEDNNNG